MDVDDIAVIMMAFNNISFQGNEHFTAHFIQYFKAFDVETL